MQDSIGLKWTGNSIIDMGVAAITLHAEVMRPEEVTHKQWVSSMNSLEKDYSDGIYIKHSDLLFTRNALDNNSFTPSSRKDKISGIFKDVKELKEVRSIPCAFFPVKNCGFVVARDQLPLVQGRNAINFYPNGQSGVSISSLAYGCILALPIVTPTVSGRLMIIGTDDSELLLDACERWLKDLKKDFAKMRLNGGELLTRKAPKTRLLETIDMLYEEKAKSKHYQKSSLILYHLSNSGSGPSIQIYTVTPLIYQLISVAQEFQYRPSWNALVQAYWLIDKKDNPQTWSEEKRVTKKNLFYEAMISLPHQAPQFIRRFLLSFLLKSLEDKSDLSGISIWKITHLFLKIIIHMEQERIEAIRELADNLAEEIFSNRDTKLFRQLMGRTQNSNSYSSFRSLLLRVQFNRLKRKKNLMVNLDNYLLIFEEGEEFPASNWRIALDLIRIRTLEKLYELNYFETVPSEVLEEDEGLEPENEF